MMDDTGRHAPAEWHALPDELMLHILTFIDLRDLCNVRVLSRRFCALADDKQCDTSVWRRRYHQEWYHGWDYDQLVPASDSAQQTPEDLEKLISQRKKDIRQESLRVLPRTEEVHSWQELFKLRRNLEAKLKHPSVTKDRAERTCTMYLEWGEELRELIPKDQDDLSLCEEEKQVIEIARTYLICAEEFLSALSFHPEKMELFDSLRLRAGIAHEYALYQKHYRNSKAALREWFGLACELYEKACALAEKTDLSAMSCNWAGALRDYASCGLHGEKKTDELFESAYVKFETATTECVGILLDHLFVENWAYALKEHANLKLKQKKYKEADKLFEGCYQRYAHCAALTEDSVVLSNWADALREQAEVKRGEEQAKIFDMADAKYEASFKLDPTDCLTVCNWAMLLVSRARKARKRHLNFLEGKPEEEAIAHEGVEVEEEFYGEKDYEKEREKERDEEEEPKKEWGARAMEKIVSWLEQEWDGDGAYGLPQQLAVQQLEEEQQAWREAVFVIDRDKGEIRKLSEGLSPVILPLSSAATPITTTASTTTTPATTTTTCTSTTTTTTTTTTATTHVEDKDYVEYKRLLATAEEKLRFCLDKEDTWSYFCMARLCSVAERYEDCKAWLNKCRDRPFLKRAKETQLADFENVLATEWFQDILREQQQKDN